MPHQCTNCGRAFDDGSKEMLSGCPDCGGNKFQFHPDGADVPDEPTPGAEPPDPPTPDSTVARTLGNAATTVRDLVGGGSAPGPAEGSSPDPTEKPPAGTGGPNPDPDPLGAETEPHAAAENAAQADARSEIVSPDEIPPVRDDGWEPADDAGDAAETDAGQPVTDGRVVDEPDGDRPDLKQLREELNDQFESIKVLSPGQYELNLMELYDREEYIIALQEDGRYTIQVPDAWHE